MADAAMADAAMADAAMAEAMTAVGTCMNVACACRAA